MQVRRVDLNGSKTIETSSLHTDKELGVHPVLLLLEKGVQQR